MIKRIVMDSQKQEIIQENEKETAIRNCLEFARLEIDRLESKKCGPESALKRIKDAFERIKYDDYKKNDVNGIIFLAKGWVERKYNKHKKTAKESGEWDKPNIRKYIQDSHRQVLDWIFIAKKTWLDDLNES